MSKSLYCIAIMRNKRNGIRNLIVHKLLILHYKYKLIDFYKRYEFQHYSSCFPTIISLVQDKKVMYSLIEGTIQFDINANLLEIKQN